MFLFSTLVLCALQAPAPPAAVELAGAEIRFADLAEVPGFEAAARAGGGRTLARLPVGRREVTLDRTALAGLVRRALPGMTVAAGEGSILFRRSIRTEKARRACFETARAVAPGEALTAADFASVSCERGRGSARLGHEAGGILRASEPLEAGRYVGRVALPRPPAVADGQGLTLIATVGPVRIERPVVALQPGRNGGRVFVRDEQGQILSVAVAVDDEEESR